MIDKFTAADLMVKKFPHLIGQLEFMEPPLTQKAFQIAFSLKTPDHEKKLQAFRSMRFARNCRAGAADQEVQIGTQVGLLHMVYV